MRTPERHEISPNDRWNDKALFASTADWQQQYDGVEQALRDLAALAGSLTSAGALLGWLEHRQTLASSLNQLMVYSVMEYSVHTFDRDAAARLDDVRALNARFMEAEAFVKPELLAIGIERLEQWFDENEALAVYRQVLERLKISVGHVCSSEVERLLGALERPFQSASSVHGVMANSDIDFGQARDGQGRAWDITQSSIGSLLSSPDRALRQSAYERYADAHLALKHSTAQLLATGAQQNVFRAQVRGYDSALHAALSANNIPNEVFHNLIERFQANIPTWHRYFALRKEMLALDSYTAYDMAAPLSRSQESISYEQSVDWLCEAMQVLGDDYVRVMRRGALEDRWVDKYPNKGKRMGAFSAGRKGTMPYIMMSYTENVFGMSTLAHELGHSMHSYLSCQHQPQILSGYTLFAAEVASNFNQAVLRSYLYPRLEGIEQKIALIEEAMANFYRYFLIMPTLARLELAIHQATENGKTLSAHDLIGLTADLFQEAYGPDVDIDEQRLGITWAQFHTHLYSNFYVYQYATGISGAHVLARDIQAGRAGSVEAYLNFLRLGGKKFPLDALKSAGVDLGQSDAIDSTFEVLASWIDELERLYRQRSS